MADEKTSPGPAMTIVRAGARECASTVLIALASIIAGVFTFGTIFENWTEICASVSVAWDSTMEALAVGFWLNTFATTATLGVVWWLECISGKVVDAGASYAARRRIRCAVATACAVGWVLGMSIRWTYARFEGLATTQQVAVTVLAILGALTTCMVFLDTVTACDTPEANEQGCQDDE